MVGAMGEASGMKAQTVRLVDASLALTPLHAGTSLACNPDRVIRDLSRPVQKLSGGVHGLRQSSIVTIVWAGREK
jgi:hypothetical protein